MVAITATRMPVSKMSGIPRNGAVNQLVARTKYTMPEVTMKPRTPMRMRVLARPKDTRYQMNPATTPRAKMVPMDMTGSCKKSLNDIATISLSSTANQKLGSEKHRNVKNVTP